MGNQNKILLVEDDAIIAMDLEMSLSDLGWEVMGPAPTADQAFDLIKSGLPDVAILDFNIRGGTSEQLAIALMEASVPVLFLSGDSSATDIDSLKECRVLAKPVSMDMISAALTEALGTLS
ncbi:response regulator [Algimonas arctica]|uniref:Response regulator n=1 Tax=Algimonas arctica TaxID=1479486 RepID=A0A8J3CRX8_9PROT|nr:response regulator [Algimonas arctica]GHB00915.1 response regulator [Algimonas arctica]